MRGQPGFFDVEERLKELSAKGDALERLSAVVDFALFRADLERAVPRSDGSKGGRPAFDLRVHTSQELVKNGVMNTRLFASRHGWAPLLPSCPTPHEIPDSSAR